MKKTTFWKSLFLLCALIVGSTSAWAKDVTVTWSASAANNFGAAITAVNNSRTGTINTGSFSWNYTNTLTYLKANKSDYQNFDNSTKFVQIGSGNARHSLNLTTSAITGIIKSVSVVCSSAEGKHNLTVTVGSTKYIDNASTASGAPTTEGNYTQTGTGTSSGTITISLTPGSGALYLKSISVTYDEKPAAPTFDVEGGEFNEAFDLTISSATGTTLKYTTDGTEPATSGTAVTVASNSTEVSIPAATTRVRAIAIKGEDISDEKDVTYTYTSKEVPTFTLSPASLNLGVGEEGDISLTTNSDGEVTFACEDAHVTLSGTGNSRTVSADAEGTYTVNVSVAATSTYTSKNGSVTVTVAKHDTSVAINTSGITNTEMKAGVAAGTLSASVTYGDPATIVPSATVTWTSTKTDVATINATTGAVTLTGAGTTQIKATYAGNDTYNESVQTYNLTVTDSRTNFFTWDLSTNSYDANPSASKIQWSNVRAIMKNEQNDGTSVINYIPTSQSSTRFYNKNILTITPQDGHRISSVEFTTPATGASYATVLANSTWTNATAAAYGTKVIVTPTNTANVFSAAITGTCGFVLVKVFYEEKTVTVTDLSSVQGSTYTGKNYATMYYSDRALAVPAGVVAKTYKMVNGALTESRTYENGGTYPVIPAGEAVVIESDDNDDYAFEVTSTETTVDEDNALKGTDATTTVDATGYKYYKLSLNNAKNKVGFFFAVSGGTSITNGAHKAYLRVATGGNARDFYLFDDTTTRITNVEMSDESDDSTPMYNLAGQRVNKSYKGVVIQNGKKMFNK